MTSGVSSYSNPSINASLYHAGYVHQGECQQVSHVCVTWCVKWCFPGSIICSSCSQYHPLYVKANGLNCKHVSLNTCNVAFVLQIFFSVYEMAIDTILLSFCEDCESNNGHPKFAPPLLMDAIGEKYPTDQAADPYKPHRRR